MARTQLTTREIGSVQRNDFDITTSGQAVITKIIAGTGVTLSSTGVDVGTGDVTINSSGGGTISLAAIGTTPNVNAATLTGSVLNLEAASSSFGGIVTTGNQIFAGIKTFNANVIFNSGINVNSSMFNVNGVGMSNLTTAANTNLLSSATSYGIGSFSTILSIGTGGNNGIFYLIGSNTISTTVSTTTPLISNLAIKPIIIAGTGTVTNSATLYIENAATGATNNYSLWIAGGGFRFDGALLPNNLSGASGQVLTSGGGGVVPTWTTFGGNITVTTLTTNTTLTISVNQILLADTTTGVFTITLPTAIGNSGIAYTIKKINIGNDLTIATILSQTIDDGLTVVLKTQYTSIDIVSNGINWFIV